MGKPVSTLGGLPLTDWLNRKVRLIPRDVSRSSAYVIAILKEVHHNGKTVTLHPAGHGGTIEKTVDDIKPYWSENPDLKAKADRLANELVEVRTETVNEDDDMPQDAREMLQRLRDEQQAKLDKYLNITLHFTVADLVRQRDTLPAHLITLAERGHQMQEQVKALTDQLELAETAASEFDDTVDSVKQFIVAAEE